MIQTRVRCRLQSSALLAQQYSTKCAGYAESRFAAVQAPMQQHIASSCKRLRLTLKSTKEGHTHWLAVKESKAALEVAAWAREAESSVLGGLRAVASSPGK